MGVYISALVLCVLGDLGARISSSDKGKGARWYFILLLAWIALFSGFRAYSVGNDTSNYAYMFSAVNQYSFGNLMRVNPFGCERGYLALNWLVGRFSTSPSALFVVIQLYSFFAIGTWIWKKSDRPFLGLLIFICMYLPFCMTGVRQTIAFAIGLLASLDFEKKRYIRFLIGVGIAMLFHASAFVFLLYFLLQRFKDPTRYFGWMAVATLILFPIREQAFLLVRWFMSDTRYGDYAVYGSTPLTYTLLLALLGIIGVAFVPQDANHASPEQRQSFIYMITALPIMAFVAASNSMMRVAMYFSVHMCIWIPKMFDSFSVKSTGTAARYIACIVLMVLFLRNVGPDSVYFYEFVGWDTVKGLLDGGF